MATFLIDLPPSDMERRLTDALSVYVDAMRYPPRHRESARRDVARAHPATRLAGGGRGRSRRRPRRSTAAVGAELSDAPLLGVAYGYRGAPDQWWQQQVVLGLQRSGFPPPEIAQLMTSYFELTELHIHPRAQGRGLGEALARRLLADRERGATSCSPRRRPTARPTGPGGSTGGSGFIDIIRGYHFAGDPRAFAILGRALPL